MIFKRPTVLYPTVILGVIEGPIRLESIDGTELFLPPGTDVNGGFLSGRVFPDKLSHIRNGGPLKINDKMYGVSHIQRRSPYFSLVYDPFIYHFGKFFVTQKEDENGKGIPGTEKGIYFRTPGWRWQVPDEKSNGTPWIFSGGRIPGSHLD